MKKCLLDKIKWIFQWTLFIAALTLFVSLLKSCSHNNVVGTEKSTITEEQ